MSNPLPKMTFHVESRRVDARGSVSRCKNAHSDFSVACRTKRHVH